MIISMKFRQIQVDKSTVDTATNTLSRSYLSSRTLITLRNWTIVSIYKKKKKNTFDLVHCDKDIRHMRVAADDNVSGGDWYYRKYIIHF